MSYRANNKRKKPKANHFGEKILDLIHFVSVLPLIFMTVGGIALIFELAAPKFRLIILALMFIVMVPIVVVQIKRRYFSSSK